MLVVKSELDGVFVVEDTEGGIWWPSKDAQIEIENSKNSERKAIEICEKEPMRGTWKS